MHQKGKERRQYSARILLVEDHPAVLLTLERILERDNYQIQTAGDGLEALRQLKRSLPDLIISDLRMPRMSGFELLSVVRHRFPHIVSIAISGELPAPTLNGLMADLFLEKGTYSPSQLLSSARDLLDHAPLRPRLPELEKPPLWLARTTTNEYCVKCNECLRFFMVRDREPAGIPRRTQCPVCDADMRYFIDPIPPAPGDYNPIVAA